LGQIGLSGSTEFPHLHLSVRHNGQVIDPFSPGPLASCGELTAGLWQPSIPLQPGGVIDVGFAQDIPSFDAVKAGTAGSPVLGQTAPALVLWAHVFGTREDDELLFVITGPDGDVIRQTETLTKTQARAMRAVGKRLRAANWPPGTYAGTVVQKRGGETLSEKSITVEITP
jgi:hypothetical protein